MMSKIQGGLWEKPVILKSCQSSYGILLEDGSMGTLLRFVSEWCVDGSMAFIKSLVGAGSLL